MKLIREYFLVGCIYLVFLVVLFPEVFFHHQTFYFADNFSLMIPAKIFLIDQLKQGAIPFWNPYLFGGIPFLADLNHPNFSFSSVFFSFLSVATATNSAVISHFIIAGLGSYFASRMLKQTKVMSFIAGLLWVFSETVLTTGSSNLSMLQSIAWLPWIVGIIVVSLTRLKTLVWLPLLISLSLFGGHPQLLTYLLAYSGAYTLVTKRYKLALSLIISGIVVAILNLFVLAPFAELSTLSTRNLATWSEKVVGSLSPITLFQWIIPTVFSDPQTGMVWGPDWDHSRMISGYAGIVVLFGYILLFFRKKSAPQHYVYWLGIVSLVFALGKNVPLLWRLYEWIPGINSFRNPAGSVGLWSLCIALYSGFSFSEVSQWIKKRPRLLLVFISVTLLTLVSQYLFITYFDLNAWNTIDQLTRHKLSTSSFHTYSRDTAILTVILTSARDVFLCGTVLLWLLYRKRVWWPVVAVVVFIDLSLAHGGMVFTAPATVYQFQSPQASWLANHLGPSYRALSSSSYIAYTGIQDYWNNVLIREPFAESRFTKAESLYFDSLIARRNNLGADWNMVAGVPLVNGYGAFVLRDTVRYWKSTADFTPINDVEKVSFNDPRLSDQGVKYITVDKTIFTDRAIPRELSSFDVVQDTADWAILENPQALPIVRFSPETHGTIQMLPATVNQINFTTSASVAGEILVKTTHYPGWKCRVDERDCEIFKDDFTMKVQSEIGTHIYRLSFAPTGWPYLLYVSLGSWLVYGIILAKRMR